MLSPIVLFTYKRLSVLKKTVNSLSENILADKSDLIIFSDGPRTFDDINLIKEVRVYLKSISGFKSIKIIESSYNLGLARSVIEGVSDVVNQYGKAIVIEDDLIFAKNFIIYMNQSLEFYQDNKKIISICGYSPIINSLNHNQSYFTHRSSSWGWATWANRWNKIDWTFSQFDSFINNDIEVFEFSKMGSDLPKMLKDQKKGILNSWSIIFCFHQFTNRLFSVHPVISKVMNIGFADSFAENTKQSNSRYYTILDDKMIDKFEFVSEPFLDKKVISQFVKSNSIISRILNKIYSFNIFSFFFIK